MADAPLCHTPGGSPITYGSWWQHQNPKRPTRLQVISFDEKGDRLLMEVELGSYQPSAAALGGALALHGDRWVLPGERPCTGPCRGAESVKTKVEPLMDVYLQAGAEDSLITIVGITVEGNRTMNLPLECPGLYSGESLVITNDRGVLRIAARIPDPQA